MDVENVKISGCSLQDNDLSPVLQIIVGQTLPGEVRRCLGEGWRSQPSGGSSRPFFLVSRNFAAAQTLVLQLTKQIHPLISLVLLSLEDPFYTSFVEFTVYLKVIKLFCPKHIASSLRTLRMHIFSLPSYPSTTKYNLFLTHGIFIYLFFICSPDPSQELKIHNSRTFFFCCFSLLRPFHLGHAWHIGDLNDIMYECNMVSHIYIFEQQSIVQR